jgi:hypothetical protein
MSIKIILQFLGFFLFVFGLLSLVLLLVGANLTMLTFIDQGSKLIGFVIRLFMIFGGVVMFYLARTDWDKENED